MIIKLTQIPVVVIVVGLMFIIVSFRHFYYYWLIINDKLGDFKWSNVDFVGLDDSCSTFLCSTADWNLRCPYVPEGIIIELKLNMNC